MEIRRKVFSRLQDENGEERLYSTNEFELSYSEEGEKMFSEKEGMSTAGKVALGTAGAAAAIVGGLEIANLLKKKTLTSKEKAKIKEWLSDAKKNGMSAERLKKLEAEYKSKALEGKSGIEFVEKGNAAVKGAYNTAKVNTQIALGKAKQAINEAKEEIKDNKKAREWRKAEQKSYEELFPQAEAAADHAKTMEGVPVRVHRGKGGKFTSRNSK